MNHELLKQVIFDQHNFIKNFEIIDRKYEFDMNANYVVVGLRRAGKTTIFSFKHIFLKRNRFFDSGCKISKRTKALFDYHLGRRKIA